MNISKKKVFITGSGGFIGRNLKETLNGDYEIIVPSSKELDLLNAEQTKEYLKQGKFDTVIHCATHNSTKNSVKDVNLVLKNNLRMFFNLARGGKFYGKMVYFGSGAEYGREFMPPKVREDDFGANVPTDDYGFSKYISNQIAKKSDNIYNLTIFGCFGKYEDWEIRFISNMICKAMYDLPLTMKQNVFFDYLYVDDLVSMVKLFIEAKNLKYHKYNVCTGQSADLLALAKTVLKVSGKNLEIKVAEAGLGREYSGNNERLLAEFGGFKFKPIKQSVGELYGWYEDHKGQIDRDLLLTDK
jgi:GDP-L-fucose synthase